VLFTYSTVNLPVATFDITDRMTLPNNAYSKTIAYPTTINDDYKNYFAKTNGYNQYSTTYTFGSLNVANAVNTNKWISGGTGGNTLAFSNDGIKWYALNSNIFTTACYDVVWNGYIWAAAGAGGNTLAYSYDGYSWTGIGTSIFSTTAYRIVWNSKIFVATGNATNNLAYSYDGINWTGCGTGMFTGASIVSGLNWNGLYWLAGSNATTNKVAISTDGINWTGIGGASTFAGQCNALLWTGGVWVGGGSTGSAGVLAYSMNNGSSWTSVPCPITASVTGLAANRNLIVAIGNTSASSTGNTLAYSSDIYGTSWTGLGTVPFNNTSSNIVNVKWANNKFVAFSTDTSNNRIVYSTNGTTWTSAPTSQTVFTTAALGGDCALTQPHTITFPSNAVITGNLVSRDNGLTWAATTTTPSSTAVGWNGTVYLFGGAPGNSSYLTYDLCGNYIQLALGSDPSGINVIRWNGTQWLIAGNSPTNRHVLLSACGLNWLNTGVSTYAQSNYPCNGLSWNGSIWVASGLTASGTYLLYSSDGLNWSQVSSTLGGGPVEWNGSYFLCGGAAAGTTTNISQSSDGVHWTSFSAGSYGTIQSITWNGNVWVVTTNTTTTTGILYSYDGQNWTGAGGTTGYAYSGVTWNGLTFVANTASNIIRYSYDGINWTSVTVSQQNGNKVLWNNSNVGTMNIQQPTVVGGVGTMNTLAYSSDGINYKSLGNTIFSSGCYCAQWNGLLWVAGGQGTNTLAYSYNGLNWTGLGTTVFTSACYSVVWNNTVWLACGAGGNTLATSTDGRTWTGQGTAIFDASGLTSAWNGTVWIVGGRGSVNTLAYSSSPNATNWLGLGNSRFTTQCNSILWTNLWVAAGSGGTTLAYNFNLTGSSGWTASTSSVFSSSANALSWNGIVMIAGGVGTGNTLATSTDGINWTGQGATTFSTACYGVTWNTKRWIAVGVGSNTIVYSYNGTTWYTALGTANLLTTGYTVASNSKIGATIVNSGLYLTTTDKLIVNTPRYYDDALASDTAISINMNLPT
jgi:hypothetical protein